MKQVLNQSSQYHASQKINATSSENNAPNNNQQSFKDQTKEFLSNLEDILTKQNQNFLDSFKIILTNIIRSENQAHNEEIKQVIIETIKAQLKNSNSASEESEEQSNRSHLSFTFGQKRSQLDSKRKKRNADKNSENNIFFLREAKFGGNGGPLNTRKDPKIMNDEFDQTIRSKLTNDIKHPNYGKSYANFMGTKSYDSFNLGNKHNFVYKKKNLIKFLIYF